MPRKAGYNGYMNTYMKDRWKRRRLEAVNHLGGKCVECGENDPDQLDFDHIDPSTKIMTIARASSLSAKRFMDELAKCQLLCKTCHINKSRAEGSYVK